MSVPAEHDQKSLLTRYLDVKITHMAAAGSEPAIQNFECYIIYSYNPTMNRAPQHLSLKI